MNLTVGGTAVEQPQQSGRCWWTPRLLDDGAACRWQVGPMVLLVSRHEREYRLYSHSDALSDDETATVSEIADPAALEGIAGFELVRHLTDPSATHIDVRPALADRAVVSKPVARFMLHPRQQIKVFVGSPLWLQARLQGASDLMLDLPIIRPSDTWFGANTREGELCYASRTNARLTLDEVSVSAIRAVTPVLLRNQSSKPLVVDKICLPVSFLSLFSDSDGRLWTEPVTISCEQQNEPSALTIERQPVGAAAQLEPVSAPRQTVRSGLVHSLNVLFG
ncbi:hypothetical protein [Motiliproteus sediminis]|uniref:hypothetical protein n=1 Tax=Motiliproteus sediminis TaxID=1468178 RepID=UPI001AEFC25F|nr:hypothetical protein [Motiliproteus sediminis]